DQRDGGQVPRRSGPRVGDDALPSGPRRHGLHRRAQVPPLDPSWAGAGRVARHVARPDASHRRAAARRRCRAARTDAVRVRRPLIDVPVAAVLDAPPAACSASSRQPDDVDAAIARNVLSILPDEPTLQLGPGGVADAILDALDRPVQIWTGLVTDAMARLHE